MVGIFGLNYIFCSVVGTCASYLLCSTAAVHKSLFVCFVTGLKFCKASANAVFSFDKFSWQLQLSQPCLLFFPCTGLCKLLDLSCGQQTNSNTIQIKPETDMKRWALILLYTYFVGCLAYASEPSVFSGKLTLAVICMETARYCWPKEHRQCFPIASLGPAL